MKINKIIIMENQANDIWKRNLKDYNTIMRLDSIIVKAMIEFAIKYNKQQQKSGTKYIIPNIDIDVYE